ncbi:transcription regulator [Aliarcobacter butzleri JV22]|uniref:helix-turn-helix transcriptional regulator n=1 Tax=Aliarcobacter butzleri TaxID=28197 RepID=UPI0001F0ED18|nr:WYL domain-containing protein [Aliarcobacter butzleri]EFU69574.1 transcription regulator [Aliarcobacter butzleri JV22]
MARDLLAKRLAFILTKLNNGERFTLKELAQEFNVDTKTISRDLKERLIYIPIKKEGNYYFLEDYVLGKLNLEDIKNFATISGIKSLYPTLTNQFLTEILENKINKAFLVKNSGFEMIENKKDDFEKLSRAIINHHVVEFIYKDKEKIVEPYKLINSNGVWYLCANDNQKLKTYTFSKIDNLKIKKDKFDLNPNFLKEIEKDEINWFSNELKEVQLKIDNSAKEYFLRKKVLSNMKIIEETSEYFIVSTKIAFDDEIINLVKYWIPYIEIISPNDLSEKLNNILNSYIKRTQPVHN